MIRMTLGYVRLRQLSVMQVILRNVGLKCFLLIYQTVCLLLSLYIYFTYISQGSVEMHLRCGGIYNNHITANFLQSVPAKEF